MSASILPIPLHKIQLGTLSPIGFKTGLLTKQGAFVRNWKLRYFSLTWNSLSYFEPDPRIFISNILLNSCQHLAPGNDEKPFAIHLRTRERTYIFLTDDKRERQHWMEALRALISVHIPKVAQNPKMEIIKKIAWHVFRILHGTHVLRNTHEKMPNMIQELNSSFFDLIYNFASILAPIEVSRLCPHIPLVADTESEISSESPSTPKSLRGYPISELSRDSFSGSPCVSSSESPGASFSDSPRTPRPMSTTTESDCHEKLFRAGQRLNNAVLAVKQEIPPEHRIQPEEPTFDISAECRRMSIHLKLLVDDSSLQSQFNFHEITDDFRMLVGSAFHEVIGEPVV